MNTHGNLPSAVGQRAGVSPPPPRAPFPFLGGNRNGLGFPRPSSKGWALPAAGCLPDAAQAAIPPQPSRPVTGAEACNWLGTSPIATRHRTGLPVYLPASTPSTVPAGMPGHACFPVCLPNFPAVLVAAGAFLTGAAHAEDACAHYAAHFPAEVVAAWSSDLVCGDTDWAEKGQALVADPNPRMSALVARYGSGEAVRGMLEPHDGLPPVIPLPGAGWLLLSALAGLWAWGRR